MKYKIFKLIFAVWVILWLVFVIKDIFIKDNLRDYKALLPRSFEGKRSYVTGDKFYEFLTFCNNKLPEGARYMWAKGKREDHDRRRATYYLYPHLEGENAEFILVYDEPNMPKGDHAMFARLDDSRYILKKKGPRSWK